MGDDEKRVVDKARFGFDHNQVNTHQNIVSLYFGGLNLTAIDSIDSPRTVGSIVPRS